MRVCQSRSDTVCCVSVSDIEYTGYLRFNMNEYGPYILIYKNKTSYEFQPKIINTTRLVLIEKTERILYYKHEKSY